MQKENLNAANTDFFKPDETEQAGIDKIKSWLKGKPKPKKEDPNLKVVEEYEKLKKENEELVNKIIDISESKIKPEEKKVREILPPKPPMPKAQEPEQQEESALDVLKEIREYLKELYIIEIRKINALQFGEKQP
jgi:hypothetical protein